ncbi:tyrosine-type recombinase/integrase [Glutamicibacter sp. AOP38-B1-38]|uniref:tyrosine-type recombinase/integrase n=1 Tax=Glutamicibacter sp. AOP38-B1-38 TaxID=3457680 RepID=UPI00403443E1
MNLDEQGVLTEFGQWLRLERGLADTSIETELWHAEKFLHWLPDPLETTLMCLDATMVLRFVAANAAHDYSRNYLKNRHRALRSFLRFLHVHAVTRRLLTNAVPAVAGWSLANVPRGLSLEQVDALLTSFDRKTAVGIRDLAMVLFMARLGMRRIEVARLSLDDIDWYSGTFNVTGKGDQREQLPLLTELGEALRDYVLNARPPCDCPSLFITMRQPYRPITAGLLSAVLDRASERAALPRVGAHQLRHTVAIRMLDSGSSLAEIGKVLRHHSTLSTAIYAKTDLKHLSLLARPWPEVKP